MGRERGTVVVIITTQCRVDTVSVSPSPHPMMRTSHRHLAAGHHHTGSPVVLGRPPAAVRRRRATAAGTHIRLAPSCDFMSPSSSPTARTRFPLPTSWLATGSSSATSRGTSRGSLLTRVDVSVARDSANNGDGIYPIPLPLLLLLPPLGMMMMILPAASVTTNVGVPLGM